MQPLSWLGGGGARGRILSCLIGNFEQGKEELERKPQVKDSFGSFVLFALETGFRGPVRNNFFGPRHFYTITSQQELFSFFAAF